MKVLVFGHMYTVPILREKFKYIADWDNFSITTVSPTLWRHALGDYKFIPATEDEKFEVIPCDIKYPGSYYGFFYRGISKLLKAHRPDIIEIDQEPASRACYEIIKKAMRIIPSSKIVVWTSEDVVLRRKFPLSYYERYTLSKINHIIACNQDTERLLRRKGYKNEISVFQFLGTSPRIFKPYDASGLKKVLNLDKGFVVGYVGRLVRGKGLETLFKAFSLLDKSCRLLVVGKGEFSGRLHNLAEELDVTNRVVFTGSVPNDEVPKYMNCLDTLVLSSEGWSSWREKFGYVIPQAMLCEVPVIGSRHGGIPDVIGDAGLLFEPGNVKELVQKINDIKDNEGLRVRYGKIGRKRALENYTVEKVARRIAGVYEGLYGGR